MTEVPHALYPTPCYPNGQFDNQENLPNMPLYYQNQFRNSPYFPYTPQVYQVPFMADTLGGYQNTFEQYQWNQCAQYGTNEAPNYDQPLGSYIVLTLENAAKWAKFHEIGNEMMVVNNGRALFPKLEFTVENAKPLCKYKISLKLRRLHDHSFEFKNGNWQSKAYGLEEWSRESNEVFSKELKTGDQLMKDGIDFRSIKIFNNGNERKKKVKKNELTEEQLKEITEKEKEMLQVYTECKYVPVVTLYEVTDESQMQPIGTFSFPETAFIAVTAYKNNQLKLLKCSENQYTRKIVKEAAKKKLTNNWLAMSPNNDGTPPTPSPHVGPSTSFDSNMTSSTSSSSSPSVLSPSPFESTFPPIMQNQVQQFPEFHNNSNSSLLL